MDTGAGHGFELDTFALMSQDEVPRVWQIVPDDWRQSSATLLRVDASEVVSLITLLVPDTPLGRQYFQWFRWRTARDTLLRDLVFPTIVSVGDFVKLDVPPFQSLREFDRSMREIGRPTHLARIAGLRCAHDDNA